MPNIITPIIPPPYGIDEPENTILRTIKEVLDVREGKTPAWKQRNVTIQDLIDLGLISESDAEKIK